MSKGPTVLRTDINIVISHAPFTPYCQAADCYSYDILAVEQFGGSTVPQMAPVAVFVLVSDKKTADKVPV